MKLNSVIYNKLMLQADEARDQGMVKLADAISNAIGEEHTEEHEPYSYDELQEDIHKDLWSIASRLVRYYGINSVDALKVDATVSELTGKTLDELERTLEVDNMIRGRFEPKLPGEDK